MGNSRAFTPLMAPSLSLAVVVLFLAAFGVTDVRQALPANAQSAHVVTSVPGGISVSRISGPDRYATANAIALAGFPSHADTVFVATGTNYPDALSAAPAAVAARAPLFLTTPDFLYSSVRDAIAKLSPSKIILVGGPSTLSSAVERSLRSLAPTVVRIAGADRYSTSKLIANYAFGAGASMAYVATGTNFPDALSAGSAAGSKRAPIILVNGGAPYISAQTSTLISGLGISKVKIAGGPGSVSSGIQNSLDAQTTTARLAGVDRFATGALLNRDAYSASTTAYLANGYNFPDALAGSVLAGMNNAPLFVVPSNCVPQDVLNQFQTLSVKNVVLLGGTPSLNTSVANLTSCSPSAPSQATAPVPVPTPAVPSSAMPVGNLPGWKQVGAQDFATVAAAGQVGSQYGTDMRGYSGLLDTSKNGTYTPDSVLSVSNGILDFYLHTSAGIPRVAAALPFGYSGQTYGRYSVRFRSDKLPGYKIAFLLWPSSDNWNEGEIDWPEGSLNGQMSPASAIKGSLVANGVMSFDAVSPRKWSATDSSDWHVATTEWTPGKVKWFWDGVLVSETSNAAGVPNTNFRWTLQAETEIGAPAPASNVAGHLQVDWAVQYAYTP